MQRPRAANSLSMADARVTRIGSLRKSNVCTDVVIGFLRPTTESTMMASCPVGASSDLSRTATTTDCPVWHICRVGPMWPVRTVANGSYMEVAAVTRTVSNLLKNVRPSVDNNGSRFVNFHRTFDRTFLLHPIYRKPGLRNRTEHLSVFATALCLHACDSD